MRIFALIATVFSALGLFAGTPGSFAGVIVEGPDKAGAWMYIEGHNHSLRRVYVHDALLHYDTPVPAAERKTHPADLAAGTRVRVMAEQDDAGEWRASEIEVLPGNTGDKKLLDSTTSQPPHTSKDQ